MTPVLDVAVVGAGPAVAWHLHERGLTPAPGLSAIGRHWQTSRGSALLGLVGRDAADRITADLRTTAAGSRRTSPRAA
ncbi:hypothetical protein [Pseudonocardia sp. T1-2H]|uniref:hypothetical protein n=1 Tax=Pseudonocardia sp. T1-2H TaxID=3128899 RepID=UPI003100D301